MADAWSAIQKLNDEESRKFIHAVIDSICDKTGPSFDQFASNLSLSEYAKLRSAILSSVKQISRHGFDRKKLTETAGTIEGISSEIASLIAECVWVRRDEVKAELVRQACSISSCDLEDYDWDTKLALSSDKLGSLQEPLLSLDLHLNDGGDKRTENFELSLDELKHLMASLDSANKIVLQLRT